MKMWYGVVQCQTLETIENVEKFLLCEDGAKCCKSYINNCKVRV